MAELPGKQGSHEITLQGSPHRFKVHRRLGAGGFGAVYQATRLGTETEEAQELALKIEHSRPKDRPFRDEGDVYDALSGVPGVPRIHEKGMFGDQYVIALDLLGGNLKHVRNLHGREMSQAFAFIAVQLISIVESVHDRGFIHRDLKPDNILLDRSESLRVYLVDFGLAKRYVDALTGVHAAPRRTKGFVGTTRYAPINAHMKLEQSRRDDLESLGYVLLYFLVPRLPWMGIKGAVEQVIEEVGEKKIWDLWPMIHALPRPWGPVFAAYFGHIQRLGFEDRPDYRELRSLFEDSSVWWGQPRMQQWIARAFTQQGACGCLRCRRRENKRRKCRLERKLRSRASSSRVPKKTSRPTRADSAGLTTLATTPSPNSSQRGSDHDQGKEIE